MSTVDADIDLIAPISAIEIGAFVWWSHEHSEPIALNCPIKSGSNYEARVVLDLNKKTLTWGSDRTSSDAR